MTNERIEILTALLKTNESMLKYTASEANQVYSLLDLYTELMKRNDLPTDLLDRLGRDLNEIMKRHQFFLEELKRLEEIRQAESKTNKLLKGKLLVCEEKLMLLGETPTKYRGSRRQQQQQQQKIHEDLAENGISSK